MAMFTENAGPGSVKLGIGSFAYRYAIGFGGFQPPEPMDLRGFLGAAHRLGYSGVQLCENLHYAELGRKELESARDFAAELGLFVELGMRNISPENLKRHLEIASLMSSRLIRVVLAENGGAPVRGERELGDRAISLLNEVLPACRDLGVTIAIENHFDVTVPELVRIVEAVDDPHVRLVFDTTNCLGFIEKPSEALSAMQPYLASVHLKDYVVKKVEAGYLMVGAVLGSGWLDVSGVLTEVISAAPGVSVILEMTTRRDEGKSVPEVLAWEQDAIEASTRYLMDLAAKQGLQQR